VSDECIHLLDPVTCSHCNPNKPKTKAVPVAASTEETIVSHELGASLIAALITAAAGAWVESAELAQGVLADPEVGDVIRDACTTGKTRWTNPLLLAGNVVGWWSSSWTTGTNAYIAQFDREGDIKTGYRYRLRT
jgi:hypothetical protein